MREIHYEKSPLTNAIYYSQNRKKKEKTIFIKAQTKINELFTISDKNKSQMFKLSKERVKFHVLVKLKQIK